MSENTGTVSVIEEIAAERKRQNLKWGEQNHPNGTGPESIPLADIVRGPGNRTGDRHFAKGLSFQAKAATDNHAEEGTVTWADILLEEVFEALAEPPGLKLRTELIQVAAVATQWVEAIDRKFIAEHPALGDPEGLALVQAIHDRKIATAQKEGSK